MKLIVNLSLILLGTSCLFAATDVVSQGTPKSYSNLGCDFINYQYNANKQQLDPFLTMNPEEIRGVEDAFGFTRMNLLPSRTATFSTTEIAARGRAISERENLVNTAIARHGNLGQTIDEKDILQAREQEDLVLKGELLAQTAQENIAKLTEQIEEAKQTFEEVSEEGELYFWKSLIAILEKSREYWNKVNELIAQGKVDRAFLWRKGAEESEISVEGIRGAVQVYISGNVQEAEKLEKEAWSDYYLSHTSTWSLKLEEVLEKADQVHCEGRDFWRDCLVSQYKIAADYEKNASLANRFERKHWESAVESIRYSIDCLMKESEAKEFEKENLAECCHAAFVISGDAARQFEKAARAHAGKEWKKDEGPWGRSFQAMAEYAVKASEAEERGKTALAAGYREAITTLEHSLEKKVEDQGWGISYTLGRESYCLNAKAEYQTKASEAEGIGKAALAASYREAVAILERAVEQYQQSDLEYDAQKENEGDSCDWAGHLLHSKADYQAKASEAEELNKVALAASYRKAATILESAVEQYQQSALAYAAEKESEGIDSSMIGRSLYRLSGYQVIAAERKEKSQGVINKNNVIVDTTEVDDNLNKESVPNKKKIDNSVKMKALFVCCEKWLAETGLASELGQFLSDYVMDVVQGGADYKLVSTFEKYRNNAIRAHEIGDDPQALGWIQIAEDIQQAIKDSIEQAKIQAHSSSNAVVRSYDFILSNIWGDAVKARQKMAEYKEKCIQTFINSQTQEIMNFRKKIIERLQFVANYDRKAAESYSLENQQEYNPCRKAASSMEDSVNVIEEIIRILSNKSIPAFPEKQLEISISWRKTLEQYQESAEYYRQAASFWLGENTTNIRLFDYAGIFAKHAACRLEHVSIGLEAAIKVRQANNAEVEAIWIKTIELYQKSFEQCRQIVDAVTTIDTTECHYFDNDCILAIHAITELNLAFSILKKITDVIATSSGEAVALWLQAVKQYHQSSEYYNKAAEATLKKNDIDRAKWKKEAESLSESAHQLDSKADQLNLINETFKKARVAEAEGKIFAAALWRKKAESYQDAFRSKGSSS